MISVDEALETIQKVERPVCDIETISLDQCLGRVLAKPIISEIDVPPANNSSMDGYAVNSSDIELSKHYAISQRVTAGTAPNPLKKGTVARIFTGAEMPADADAIIIQENSTPSDQGVNFHSLPNKSDNVRFRGQDIGKGSEILSAGTKLRPQEIGLIASCGISSVEVYKKLRIAILGTGDELVEPGQALPPGKIYNSNKYLLQALCIQSGFEPVDMGSVQDDFETTLTALDTAAKNADIVITSGGVSVGEEDHVKPAVEKLGHIDLWKIAIKPGKPLAMGKVGDTEFIGLPGNPSSVFTTFLILALPRLQLLQGQKQRSQKAELSKALFEKSEVRRREFLRAKKTPQGIEIFPNQSSGVLSSACWGDGFAVQYEASSIRKEQPIKFISYQSLIS